MDAMNTENSGGGVLQELQERMSAELMQQWNAGFRQGLQAAEKMAAALVDSGELSEQQMAVVLGLKFSLQNAQEHVGSVDV